MKGMRFLYALTAAMLLAGCFKKVSLETAYVLKPQVQELSGDPTQAVTGVKTYAFAADTNRYTVASYEDALNGIITLRENPSEKISTPSATGEAYETEGAEGIPALPQEGFMFLSGQAKILRQAGLVFSQVLP